MHEFFKDVKGLLCTNKCVITGKIINIYFILICPVEYQTGPIIEQEIVG